MSPESSDPPALPSQIAGYRIVARLGSGGMGEVFLAEDDRLQRRVAVKRLLPSSAGPAAARRLLVEARAAARLDHPHVCGIYEVGEDNGAPFIVMPVVEGETLAARLAPGPLPITDALDIAMQVADALTAAHALGVFHRDIKPANLMIGARGHVRVMDFGLATFVARETDETTSRLTLAGTALGTVAYMSPEQARGDATDGRSDLFSLGVVLFEMVAGCRPFERRTVADELTAVLSAEPPPLARLRPEAPAELERIVSKMLRKSPKERYQSAVDLQVDLRNLLHTLRGGSTRELSGVTTSKGNSGDQRRSRTAQLTVGAGLAALLIVGIFGASRAFDAKPGIGTLAVLPFVNNSGDVNKEYVADGITQTLIDSLSQVPNLKVMSRSTVFTFKGKTGDTRQIAERLGVGAVMTGAISEVGGQLVIDVELSSAEDASIIVSHRYVQQPSSGVLVMESDIARDVTANLRLKLTGNDQRQLAAVPTKNPEAYQLYLKGRFYENRLTPDALHQAVTFYRQATVQDPAYAQAYAGLAQSYAELGLLFEAPRETMPLAKQYANQALLANPSLIDARMILGVISLVYDWDWDAAARAVTTSAGVMPAALEVFSCTAHLLESTGHGPEGEQQLRRALATDPLSSVLTTELGCGSYYRRRYDAAIQENLDALELDPDSVLAYWGLGRAYGQKKMFPEALEALNKVETRLGSAPSLIIAETGYVHAAAGRSGEARAILRRLEALSATEFVDPYLIAAIHGGLGDTAQTFAWLEKAYQAKSSYMVALTSEPKWDRVRSDPRFQALTKRVGF